MNGYGALTRAVESDMARAMRAHNGRPSEYAAVLINELRRFGFRVTREQEPGETLRAAVLYGPDVEFPNLPNGPYLTGPDVLLAVAHYMDRQDDEAERMAAGSGYRANRDVQAHLREWSRRLRAALEADPQETER